MSTNPNKLLLHILACISLRANARSKTTRTCLRQPIAHDNASAAVAHGTRQMAQLGFVVKSPMTAAVGLACTAMSSSVEHDGSAGLASWRSVRAAPSAVFPAPVDDSCVGMRRVRLVRRLPDSSPPVGRSPAEEPAPSIAALATEPAKAAPWGSNVGNPWLGRAPVTSTPSSRVCRRRAVVDVRYAHRSRFTAVSWRLRSEISRRCSSLALPN